MSYKVVIPTAGAGNMAGPMSGQINPALAGIGNKPVISYIIEQFPKDASFVIILGYKEDQVRDYLTMAHEDTKFEFRTVDRFEGEGAGLGRTLLCCEDLLQEPFIFCSDDTIVESKIPLPDHNWMGYMDGGETDQYRCIQLDSSDNVSEITAKGAKGENFLPYIGLAGIKDYKTFWESMKTGAPEIGESIGLRALIPSGVKGHYFNWSDTGNEKSFEDAKKTLAFDAPVILEKPDEAIWFVNGKVIKFSLDENFIKNRAERAKNLQPYVPEILASSKNMYMYAMIQGREMSRVANPAMFYNFLEYMKGFWTVHKLDAAQMQNFKKGVHKFYRDKTIDRVNQYFTRFEENDEADEINGRTCPKLMDILKKVDWDWLAEGVPVRFHGDLHFENMLITEDSKRPFILLDWRQDFAGDLSTGDIYYDLAKLAHGLIISHQLIHQELFSIDKEGAVITYDFLRKHSQIECLDILEEWTLAQGYSHEKTMIITALIFLNIAALHTYPYSRLLFYLGKNMLWQYLQAKE
ncbi:MAG: phosphotransferase [Alphaproteobacteria bacterium]|nr:phosphotransferase [Alphaproteobacteria bacterium]